MNTIFKQLSAVRPRSLSAMALLAATGLGSGQALATTVTFNLCAKSGSMTLPVLGGSPPTITSTVFGYTLGACAGSPTISAPGGPVISVNVGDTVTVNLTNNLTEATGLLFQGQTIVPDTTGAAASGGTKQYIFTASAPGTYLYEAALLPNAAHQNAMGLYGALVVRPATANQAYLDPATAYNDEAVLVLSEIDPALNANQIGFDLRDFAPKYFLINGKHYPNTDVIAASTPGNKVLLRYVNAGIKHHSMAVLGLRQNFVAKDASLLPTLTHNVAAETLAPGQTGDAIVTVPTVTSASKFAVYDANLMLHNSNAAGMGGMLTFVTAGSGAAPPPLPTPSPLPLPTDTLGPISSGLALSPNPANGTAAVVLTATGNDSTTGNSNVASATYSIDGLGSPAMSLVGSAAPVVGLTATIPATTVSALSEGVHAVTVISTDSVGTGNVGLASSPVNLIVDKTGPVTSGVTASPNPTNGAIGVNSNIASVRLTAALNDATSIVVAGEAFIDATGTPATGTGLILLPSDGVFNTASETGYIDIPLGTISALSNGNHTLSVRGKDAAGNWGALVPTTLVVDKAAPTFTSVTPATSTVKFGAASTVNLTVNGSNGTGTAVTGGVYWFDSATIPAVTIPLTGTSATINTSTLSGGAHTVRVQIKDAAGNVSVISSPVTINVVQAVANAYSVNANTSTTQTVNINTANGLLTNDLPTGVAGRTATIVAGSLHRIDNNNGTGPSAGTGTIAVTLATNGSFTYTLTAPASATTTALRQNAKRGHYSFTYTETLNGVVSDPATVTITVN